MYFGRLLKLQVEKLKKKSEDLIPIYFSLFYLPQNNEIHITSIAGIQNSEILIKEATNPQELILISEFKGINIYRLFFKGKRNEKIEKLIKRKKREP